MRKPVTFRRRYWLIDENNPSRHLSLYLRAYQAHEFQGIKINILIQIHESTSSWHMLEEQMEKKCQAEQAGLKDPKAQEDHQLVKRIIALPQEKLLTPKDLVSVGIGQSVGRLGLMRLRGEGPKFICIPRRTYLYAPCDVIAWLRTCQDTITPPNVPKSKRVYPKQAKNAPGRSV